MTGSLPSWQALQGGIAGEVVLPGSPADQQLPTPFNARFHDVRCSPPRSSWPTAPSCMYRDNHRQEPFWALRGAGAGNFGVVTQLVFGTVPAPQVTNFHLTWPP